MILTLRGEKRDTESVSGKEEEMTLSGAALMHAGLPIPPAKGDYCAWQIHLVRI